MARIKYSDSVTQQWVYGDMAVALPPSRLPSAYQEVEYIESDGTGQYIDTGITPIGTTTIILDFEFKNTFVSWGGVFGAYSSNKHFAVTWQANDGVVHYCHGSSESGDKTFTRNKRYVLKIGEMLSATSDSCFNYSPSTFTADTSIWLFTYAHSTSTFAEKIYRFQHYENGLIQHDFIPCYRISDSVIGMYDTVNDVFYTNSGTGTFTKGGNV